MDIKSSAKPIPKKLGTVQKIDADGNVTEERNAFTLLGPPPDKCQICATDHTHDTPHNQQSLYYQQRFYAEHGRWPTWTDAMAHCTDSVKAMWKKQLIKLLKQKGLEVPEDLLEEKSLGR